MFEENYIIILDDGTEVTANLNMNTWETMTELNDSAFDGNTENVKYITPDGEAVVLGQCKYTKGIWDDGKYLFFLNPLSVEEKNSRQQEDIAPVENGTTASTRYEAGSYITRNGQLYKVISEIAFGAKFTSNNIQKTTIMKELKEEN